MNRSAPSLSVAAALARHAARMLPGSMAAKPGAPPTEDAAASAAAS